MGSHALASMGWSVTVALITSTGLSGWCRSALSHLRTAQPSISASLGRGHHEVGLHPSQQGVHGLVAVGASAPLARVCTARSSWWRAGSEPHTAPQQSGAPACPWRVLLAGGSDGSASPVMTGAAKLRVRFDCARRAGAPPARLALAAFRAAAASHPSRDWKRPRVVPGTRYSESEPTVARTRRRCDMSIGFVITVKPQRSSTE